MTKDPNEQSNSTPAKGVDKVPENGSHEDFGEGSRMDAPGDEKGKSGHKEETGATESGNEDKGAKL